MNPVVENGIELSTIHNIKNMSKFTSQVYDSKTPTVRRTMPFFTTGKKIFYTIYSLIIVSTPLFVYAAQGTEPVSISVTISNPLKNGYDSIGAVIKAVLENVIMPIAAVFIIFAIIYSGFKYVTAQGKPEEINKANKGLMYVLIGAAILLGAVGISDAIQSTICGQLISC